MMIIPILVTLVGIVTVVSTVQNSKAKLPYDSNIKVNNHSDLLIIQIAMMIEIIIVMIIIPMLVTLLGILILV